MTNSLGAVNVVSLCHCTQPWSILIWLGWLFDHTLTLTLADIIRPALTYGSGCWAIKGNNKRQIATTEMRMLRGILGVSRRDQMQNEEIQRILHLSLIDELMRSGRLRWFGHVQRTDENNITRRVMALAIPGTRRWGRPKKTYVWHQQIKEDMTGVGVIPRMWPKTGSSREQGQGRPLARI